MFKNLLTSLILLALVCCVTYGQPSVGTWYHEIQIMDEEGANVTDITSVSIYGTGTTSTSTIYAGRNKSLAMTNPVTTASTNTTLVSGLMSWWGPSNYDFSITDGTNIHTNYGFRTRTPSEGKITFPSYLHAASTTSWTDAQSITLGTGSDWVINAGTTADLLTFTPATNGAVFRIGLADGTKSGDFQVYTASGVGLIIDEGTNAFGITGLTTSINASSNYDTNVNTGSSTGAVTIGSSTSGAWALDGTSTGALNADDSIAVTVSAGTIDIDSTGGDLGIDATDKSILIDAGETGADDAVTITATGAGSGIDITSLGDIDITTTGTAAEDITLDNQGGSVHIISTEAVTDGINIDATGGVDIDAADDISLTLTAGSAGEDLTIQVTGAADGSIVLISSGTAANAIDIDTSAGGIDIDMAGGAAGEDFAVTTATSVHLISSEAVADAINIDATGAAGGIDLDTTNGGITLTAGNASNGDITLTAADDLILAVTGAYNLGGTAPTNAYRWVEIVTAATQTLLAAESGKTIVSNYTGDCTQTLPTAAAGLWFTFVDGSSTSADDLIIVPSSGDQIDNDTAGDAVESATDAYPQSCTLLAVDATDWHMIVKVGTWDQQ